MTSATSHFQRGMSNPGLQNPTSDQVMGQSFFMSEEKWKRAREESEYDVIIIGSGFCALAFADQALKNDPFCRILIVERGSMFLPVHFQNLPMPFAQTLGGLSETFPWTVATQPSKKPPDSALWARGCMPFFGGRSTVWSTWCPRPTDAEMYGWPTKTIDAAKTYFAAAEQLLHVQKTDEIDSGKGSVLRHKITGTRPVYGELQKVIQQRLEVHGLVDGIFYAGPAPLASDAKSTSGIDFQKYSVPGDLLMLATQQASRSRRGEGSCLDIAAGCIVKKILQQHGRATALDTSRGLLPTREAKLVLAMGTLPPTTLVRNSFPEAVNVGKRLSAHFVTCMVARIPRRDLENGTTFGDLELAACYLTGKVRDYKQQFHIQLSVLSDIHPEENAGIALRYMPDAVATASIEQLLTSKEHVVFVCVAAGELDADNERNSFLGNDDDSDLTTNSILSMSQNQNDAETWDAMDKATFDIVETALSPKGSQNVEYWHGSPTDGSWESSRPAESSRRIDGVVHESSTLYIGEEDSAPVDINYRLRGTANVYITGGGLWPRGGSWNPTLTMVGLAQHLADLLVNPREIIENGTRGSTQYTNGHR